MVEVRGGGESGVVWSGYSLVGVKCEEHVRMCTYVQVWGEWECVDVVCGGVVWGWQNSQSSLTTESLLFINLQ